MPRFDGTGPSGTGPFGRGMGPCGGGHARGRANRFSSGEFNGRYSIGNQPINIDQLEQQKKYLENELSLIERKMSEMKEAKETKDS